MFYFNEVTELLLLTLTVLLFTWWFWTKRKNEEIFKKMGIPCASSIPLAGCIPWLILKGTDFYAEECFKRYGKVCGVMVGTTPTVFISEPELIKQVLIKDFSHFVNRRNTPKLFGVFKSAINSLHDDEWKRVRSILSPTFTSGKMRAMMPLIEDSSRQLGDNLADAAEKQETIEVKEYVGAFALDVIAATAFGLRIDCLKNPDNPFMKNVLMQLNSKHIKAIFTVMFPRVAGVLQKYFGFEPLLTEPIDYLTRVVEKAMADRAAENDGEGPVDFLGLSMRAQIDDATLAQLQKDGQPQPKKTLSHDEIIANSITFLLAGYETTATTLSFVAHQLALYPEWQGRAYREVQEEMGQGEVTYEKVQRLKTVENIMLETLRIYAPALLLERQAGSAVVLGDIPIDKGMSVMINMASVHMNPDLFPDPTTFNPDRFEDDHLSRTMSFLAFGQGPRECIGRRLALLEMKLAVASMLQAVSFHACDQTQIPLKFRKALKFLIPSRPIRLAVKPRLKN